MNPEEIDYSECAPEIEEAHQAFALHIEQEVLKLDGFCTCDEDSECRACRTERLTAPPPIMWPSIAARTAVAVQDEALIEARIDEILATTPRRTPQTPTPRYAFGRRSA